LDPICDYHFACPIKKHETNSLRPWSRIMAGLWRLTAGYAREQADSEDLLQDILVAILGALTSFRRESSPGRSSTVSGTTSESRIDAAGRVPRQLPVARQAILSTDDLGRCVLIADACGRAGICIQMSVQPGTLTAAQAGSPIATSPIPLQISTREA
jgi:hypothetical protein